VQPPVARRLVSFDHHLHVQLGSRGLDGGDEIEVVLQVRERRQEDVEPTITRLDAQSSMHDLGQPGVVVRYLLAGAGRRLTRHELTVALRHLPVRVTERRAWREQRVFVRLIAFLGWHPRQRIERQAVAHG
jgi:hypothetical protein